VVLRYFTVYGPGQRPDMALHRFISAVAAGRPVTVYGGGDQVRDFTYVSDAAAATLAAVEADVAPASVFNVASGSPATVNDLLTLVSEHVGRPLLTRHLAAQAGDVRATHGSVARARRELGWQAEVTLDDGIKRQVVTSSEASDGGRRRGPQSHLAVAAVGAEPLDRARQADVERRRRLPPDRLPARGDVGEPWPLTRPVG
jgi:nucleoside-diphosphate-sugar epimerase